ncbi:hypothetical protein [Floricoccus penangensis]|uniref:hypothetical protein n=1 Tax=Floricoccus penangensis TaxID=1859475 RepID=UPI00203AD3A6|nr:hypothetical protein [Floricoccus penangensis]URZ87269.1 hypothetical protein KIW23_09415 [Floricoccus penangensis]
MVNVVATFSPELVKSDGFNINDYTLRNFGKFNIDDQTKKSDGMRVVANGKSAITNNVIKDEQKAKDIDVSPEYTENSITDVISKDGKDWSQEVTLDKLDEKYQIKTSVELGNHIDFKGTTVEFKLIDAQSFDMKNVTITDFEGKDVKDLFEFELPKLDGLNKDGKKSDVTVKAKVKDPSKLSRIGGKYEFTFKDVNIADASQDELKALADKDGKISFINGSTLNWEDLTQGEYKPKVLESKGTKVNAKLPEEKTPESKKEETSKASETKPSEKQKESLPNTGETVKRNTIAGILFVAFTSIAGLIGWKLKHQQKDNSVDE